MPDELRVVGAFLVSLVAVWVLAPAAMRLAVRTSFYDHPRGYKSHVTPTAYLGGVALVAGFAFGALVFVEDRSLSVPIVACAGALCALGTLDDRVTVRPSYRVLAEIGAAALLWAAGLGWSFLGSDFEQLVLTCLWVVGFTNAFNLMDNMDGAASTVGCVCAAGIAGVGLVNGAAGMAAVGLALSGACAGFLRYNLRRRGAPARIFLGDGGSMPMGFILAAAVMVMPVDQDVGWPVLLAGGLLLGLPVLDTMLVVVSRTRRRVSLVTGGRDHLTHRLLMRLGSVREVAVALAVAQAGVSGLAIVALEYGRTAVIVAAMTCLAAGGAIIAILEAPAWSRARHREALTVARD